MAPALCAAVHEAWQAGDAAKALALHDALMPLHTALFVETSPAPVKHAASLLGLCGRELRLPLVGIGEATAAGVAAALVSAGLLSEDVAQWRAAK